MQINLIWDSSVSTSAPTGFQAAVQAAANYLGSVFSSNITLNFRVGYGEISNNSTDTSSSSVAANSAEGGPSTGQFVSVSTLKSDLLANAASSTQVTADNSISTSLDPNGNGGLIAVWRAQEKALGITAGGVSANDAGYDGSIGIGSGWNSSDWEGVALHELTHAMGRISGYSSYGIQDLFRYSAAGHNVFAGGSGTQYFSINNGVTDLANYSNSSDYGDWNGDSLTALDPCDAFYQAGTNGTKLSSTDLELMNVLGFNSVTTSTLPVLTVHANDLTYSQTASGANHFIDFLNFEASYGDLIAAFGSNQTAMQNWYNVTEPNENRIETFDGLDYVASYGDLINAFGPAGSLKTVQDDGAMHFINSGTHEGRTTTFNGLDYIASYGDLIKAFGANNDAGAYHYIESGNKEGRSATFDGLDYIASYGDLIKAFGANEQAGAAHFINSGYNEHRSTTFDGLSYIAQYTDLMSAFGANNDVGAQHYITSGVNEHRTTSFDVAAYENQHTDLLGKYATNDQFLTAYINTYTSSGHFLT